MEFLNRRCFLNNKVLCGILMMLGCSFPAYAANDIFSYLEFTIAFVLGLSLPILLLSVLVRKVAPNGWWYFGMLMLSVLGLLYSLIYLTHFQAPAVLTFSIATITFMYLWAFKTNMLAIIDAENEYFNHFRLGERFLLLSGALYIALIWLAPGLDAYIGWMIFASIVLLCAAIHIAIAAKIAPNQVVRLVGQWLLVSAFVVVTFFYLHAQTSLLWLVSVYVASFLVALINGNWELTQRIFQLISDNQSAKQPLLTPEQLFSFTHDPATNLPSYQQALMRMEQLMKQESQPKYAAIVFKPKNFEHVNRVLGHQNSDILLLQLAYCLKREASNYPYLVSFDFGNVNAKVARLPSLHFLAILDLNQIEFDAKHVINELCKSMSDAVPPAMSFKSFSLRFELVGGVAYTNLHGQVITDVISRAEDALLEAEKQGELWREFDHNVALYTEQQLRKMEQLKQDIEHDGLTWHIAPQIDMASHQIKGFSLVPKWRFNAEELSLADFIDVAEHSGEVHNLTKQMIVMAFKTLFELRKHNVFQPIGIHLNSQELLEPDLADFIEKQIATYSISAKYLMVQMSERVMQLACERAKSLIDQLKSMEVGICISEFDGSYESLRYIRRLSVDQLQINCARLSDDENATAEKAIVNSLVSLSRTMKLNFIGTHVNTKQAQNIYSLMGGQIIEGDIVTPSINVNALEEWLQGWFKQHPSAEKRQSSLDV
ncbi:EAL domain-containing protein [Thalassotalea euphylliae]|uniref:EAL domain-containing protein n=1 Tax=Thalassotalea euphylliae TaxID=1655234 RepID=UPI00362A3329